MFVRLAPASASPPARRTSASAACPAQHSRPAPPPLAPAASSTCPRCRSRCHGVPSRLRRGPAGPPAARSAPPICPGTPGRPPGPPRSVPAPGGSRGLPIAARVQSEISEIRPPSRNRHRGAAAPARLRPGPDPVRRPRPALDQPRHAPHARSTGSTGAQPPTWPSQRRSTAIGGSQAAINGPAALRSAPTVRHQVRRSPGRRPFGPWSARHRLVSGPRRPAQGPPAPAPAVLVPLIRAQGAGLRREIEGQGASLRREIDTLRTDVGEVRRVLHVLSDRVARIEGALSGPWRPPSNGTPTPVPNPQSKTEP